MTFEREYYQTKSSHTSRYGYWNEYLRNAARMDRFQPKTHTLENGVTYAESQSWYLKREIGM